MTKLAERPAKTTRARIDPLLPIKLTKLGLWGRRAPLTRTPGDAGLAYEEVGFDAADGLRLRGWFIPSGREGRGPAVVFVHGWLWNRLGNVAGQVPVDDRDVDFLPATRALHDSGHHVLLFDLRNHGESARDVPITYGVTESRDVVGAVRWLRTRAEVDGDRIGALGCSMGANAILYGTPDCQPVKAVLAVQATRAFDFTRRFAETTFGAAAPITVAPMPLLVRALGGPDPRRHDPTIPARRLGDTLVRYVQGTGDQWGSMATAEELAEVTPNALPLVRYESAGRYEGYRYVNEMVGEVADFFARHL